MVCVFWRENHRIAEAQSVSSPVWIYWSVRGKIIDRLWCHIYLVNVGRSCRVLCGWRWSFWWLYNLWREDYWLRLIVLQHLHLHHRVQLVKHLRIHIPGSLCLSHHLLHHLHHRLIVHLKGPFDFAAAVEQVLLLVERHGNNFPPKLVGC